MSEGKNIVSAPSPLAVAIAWVSRITSIAILMVAPGILGGLLDRRLETTWLAPVGLAVGVAAGLAVLVQLSKNQDNSPGGREQNP